jgi:hypothetical protein
VWIIYSVHHHVGNDLSLEIFHHLINGYHQNSLQLLAAGIIHGEEELNNDDSTWRGDGERLD